MQVKLFSAFNPLGKKGQNQQDFESMINQWLSQNEGVEIVDIKQSACSGSMSPAIWVISVWYRKTA